MYETYVLDLHALVHQTVHCARPKADIGSHGILDEHRYLLVAVETLGDLLHGEGRYGRSRADPQNVDAVFERALHMGAVGYLDGYRQARRVLHLVEPFEAGFAYALECSRVGARFPHARADHVHLARAGQLHGGLHRLLAGLCAARSRYDEGPFSPEFEFSHSFSLFQYFPDFVGLAHGVDQPLPVVALDHAAQYLQLVYVLAQYVQHVVLVAQKYGRPSLRQALGQTHRALETSAREIEYVLLLALLLQYGQRQRERCYVRYVRHVGAMGVLLLADM